MYSKMNEKIYYSSPLFYLKTICESLMKIKRFKHVIVYENSQKMN